MPEPVTVTVADGVDLHVLRWDAGPTDRDPVPVVLVHGLGSNAHLWEPWPDPWPPG